ncbi:MAG: lysophospholipid acyltransferase family protein [Ginsengibacter sp.]
MNAIKEILGRIFALWALLVFIITMLAVLPAMWIIGLIKEPERTEVFRKISKVWMSLFFALTGCTLKVNGKQHFKNGENYIVICNHNSLMDVPITTPFIPGTNKTIAKIELARIPLFGLIYKRGSILVDRKDKDSRMGSFKKMKDVIDMGMHMCIYPEGTRNKTAGPLKAFHDGAFKLAFDTKKPLLPAIIFNTKKVLPADKIFFFWPSKMELHFLLPVEIKSTDTIESLKREAFAIMSNYYFAYYGPS